MLKVKRHLKIFLNILEKTEQNMLYNSVTYFFLMIYGYLKNRVCKITRVLLISYRGSVTQLRFHIWPTLSQLPYCKLPYPYVDHTNPELPRYCFRNDSLSPSVENVLSISSLSLFTILPLPPLSSSPSLLSH